MAPLDWGPILQAKPDSLSDENVDSLYDILKDAQVGEGCSVDSLLQLFTVTQVVMVSRHNLVEDTMAEAETEAKRVKKKEQELKNECERLQKEINDLKRFGADGGGGGVNVRDSRYLRDMVRELEDSNEQLKQEIKDLNRDLNSEKRAAEKYSERISNLEGEMKELRDDNDQLRQDLSDYKMQVQAQRDNIMSQQGSDTDFRHKLGQKNHELAEAMEELQNLTDANEMLHNRCNDLQTNLDDAVQEMDRTTEDYVKLKVVLQQCDTITDKLREENNILKPQVQDLSDQVRSKAEADDSIMVAVNNKIEDWQYMFDQKDAQIVELQEQVFHLREQLIAANMDSDKVSVSNLTQLLKDSDQQIEDLKMQTSTYVSEMEASAAVVEDLRAELNRAGSGRVDIYQSKIRDSQNELAQLHDRTRLLEEDKRKTEQDAGAKDKELTVALERMHKYERGEYGLEEAVLEIKEKKVQVKVRDRQIEELTQYINKVELKVNEVLDKNEELRFKLGMDPRVPLDLTGFRKNKAIRREEEKALNFILQRQIEQLEEERVNDKVKIRRLCQQLGKRAVELGLKAEDIVAVHDFTENLRARGRLQEELRSPAAVIKRTVEEQEYQLRDAQSDEDCRWSAAYVTQLELKLSNLRTQCTQLEQENKGLTDSLKEVMTALQHDAAPPLDSDVCRPMDDIYRFPVTARLLAAIEAKRSIGNYDTSLYLKEQVDILRGHNEELRLQLKEARLEEHKLHFEERTVVNQDLGQECLSASLQVCKLENVGVAVEGNVMATTGIMKPLSLPDNLTATSAETIASLNDHLIVTLQELTQRSDLMLKMEHSLEHFKRKYGVLRHQQGLMYEEYLGKEEEWKNELKTLSHQLRNLQGERDDDSVKVFEYDRLLGTLQEDDNEVRRRLSEMTRRITVLRVNEKALIRKYTTIQEIEDSLRKEVNRMLNERNQIESSISQRVGFLQRYKDTASFKIAALQKVVVESVSQSELDCLNREYHKLTEKYRDFLEKGNNMVDKIEIVTNLENEVKHLKAENEELKSTMRINKERLHALEAVMEKLHEKDVSGDIKVKDADVISISQKVTMIEMKEINERQKAEHAVVMLEQQQNLLSVLECRNKNLEEKFAEVTRMNLMMQETERELRDELSSSVPSAVSEADRKKNSELEERELSLKHEISKVKDVADVALHQVQTFELQQVSREKENKSLRQQLLDFQVQSDEKTLIGKLHRAIVKLQISESSACKKVEVSQNRMKHLEACVLRLEQKLSSKEQSLFHVRQESQSKIRYLKRNLQELRLQFAGAIPLVKQEKFTKNMLLLQQDKAKIDRHLIEVQQQNGIMEDKIAELSLQREGLQELIGSLKEVKGASKVAEWYSNIETVRLVELRQRRQNKKLNQKIKYLEEIIQSHEVSSFEIEGDNVRLMKEFEERQMRWEHREAELERNVLTLEKQAAEISSAAEQFEVAVGTLPNSELPVANQLQQAISAIKSNVKVILDVQAENESLKKNVHHIEQNLRDTERTLIEREKLISELRLRMPATVDRDTIIDRMSSNISVLRPESGSDADFTAEQGMRIAQSTLSCFQKRLHQKEETVQKYQEMLKQARQDMIDMNRRQEQELKSMQARIHASSDAALIKFKQAANEVMEKQASVKRDTITEKQLQRLTELEDFAAEQQNTISALSGMLKEREDDVVNLTQQMKVYEKEMKDEQKRLNDQHIDIQSKKDQEIEEGVKMVAEKNKEMCVLNDEIAALKEAYAHGPSVSLKNMVERLRHQLALKDQQHQALSKALTDLRADIVAQAESNVIAHAEELQQERNLQRLIDSRTNEISEQLEDCRSHLERSKRDLKKRKENEALLQTELEDVKEELNRKECACSKLRSSKSKLESEIDELEKKVERITSQKQLTCRESSRTREVDDLLRRNRYLEDELRRNHSAEKPYEQREDKAKSEETIKWEEGKKWQRTVEKMKTKIKEKNEEVVRLSTLLERLKMSIDESDKNKELSDNRSRLLSKSTIPRFTSASVKLDHDKEDLKQLNFDLEQQVLDLKKEVALARDVANKENEMHNSYLRTQLNQLERTLSQKSKDGTIDVAAYKNVYEKNQQLQCELLKLSKENMELRFEAESARIDVPRLKERVSDLNKYVEALKRENFQLTGDSARSSSSSSIRRFGDSGKSTRELERTIALLKKVVERVQQENGRLKKSPAVVGSEHMGLLKMENDQLRTQLEDLKLHMGGTLSERYTSQQKGTTKMMNDYEKMRKDLLKEKERNEQLRVELCQSKLRQEQANRELTDANGKLVEMECAKRPSSTPAVSLQHSLKSSATIRCYETKIKGLESDVEEKLKQILALKSLLSEASGRESNFIRERNDLQQKVDFFSKNVGASAESVWTDCQQAKQRVVELEQERSNLLKDVRLTHQLTGHADESVLSEIIMKAGKYDEMAMENVESMLEMKSLKLENYKLKDKVVKLQKELESFGPDFFEEIEDLKYNYKQSVQRSMLLEEKLRLLAQQFDVSVGVPGIS